jgi:hypothetical protein
MEREGKRSSGIAADTVRHGLMLFVGRCELAKEEGSWELQFTM